MDLPAITVCRHSKTRGVGLDGKIGYSKAPIDQDVLLVATLHLGAQPAFYLL
jgi:hypothetical protein